VLLPPGYGDAANEDRRYPVLYVLDGQNRTLPGQPNTGIGRSSYGGVATLYALLAKPGTFGYGLIESPSMSVGRGQLMRDTSPLLAGPVPGHSPSCSATGSRRSLRSPE